MACDQLLKVSPENPACAWCQRYCINLDLKGRICSRCQEDPGFRRHLELNFAIRNGVICGETSYCERFLTKTNPEQCHRCKSDPGFRSFLFGQGRQRRRELRERQMQGCAYRGRVLRVKARACCGGKKEEIEVFVCDKLGEASCDLCAECTDWKEADSE